MINLLPPDRSQSIRDARFNTRLRLWLLWLGFANIGLIVIMASGWLYINRQSNGLKHNIADAQSQLAAQDLPKVQKEADEISGDVKVVNQVLSQEIRFSDLLKAVGQIMPQGTILDSLTLGSIKGAIDLSASARNYSSAAQIAVNLGDPQNGLFSKVDIININCTSGKSSYRCNATFKALFSKAAQTQFLSVAKGGQK